MRANADQRDDQREGEDAIDDRRK